MHIFTKTDCWILFSVGFSDNGSTLKSIISTGDMLNHAVATKDELETSLNRLLHNDYIRYQDDKFYTTAKAKRFYNIRKRKWKSEGFIDEWLRISKSFSKQHFSSSENKEIIITDEDYNKALSEYRQTFSRFFK